jgi:predicted DCC family thiol-disulfide oxidoreductase YuxK
LEGLLKTLVYDGGCPFCQAFALRSELKGGIPDLRIRDGRLDDELREDLRRRGFNLNQGAVLIDGEQIWHGSRAISVLCSQLKPSDPLLALLNGLFRNSKRARFLYPGLLAARQLALIMKGLPLDPDRT